jgi:hypothetical protein
MPSPFSQFVLFASSFAPLFVLFGILESFGGGLASILCYLVAFLALLGLAGYWHRVQAQQTIQQQITNASARDQDLIGYVVTYLLPFITLGTASWRERGAMLAVVALIALLYIRASLFYVNPLLALARYRLFEAELGSGRSVIIITKRRFFPPGAALKLRTITESVYVEAACDSDGGA